MIQITAVHMVGGERHEHIASVKWRNPQTEATGQNTREQIVEWLGDSTNRATVSEGTKTVEVKVVNATPPYLRTQADGIWKDNLLALPRF